jgi:hypothetical protein
MRVYIAMKTFTDVRCCQRVSAKLNYKQENTMNTKKLESTEFTETDRLGIREKCIACTMGEETWQSYELENGKVIVIDCFDEWIINDENPTCYMVSAYAMDDDGSQHIRTDLGEYQLESIAYAEMK